jgi:hypothetical protein
VIFSAALRIYRDSGCAAVLAHRPRGSVVHVCATKSSGRASSASRAGRLRPVCGTRCRRLTRCSERYSPLLLGLHESGRPLCRRCSARALAVASSAPRRAEQSHPLTTPEILLAAQAVIEPGEYWQVVAAALDRRSAVRMILEVSDALADARRSLRVGDEHGPLPHARTVRVTRREMAELVEAGGGLWPVPLDDPDGRDRAVLAFERLPWTSPAVREAVIRDVFGMSITRYLQRLHVVVDTPWAIAADPVLVNRVRAARAAARARRCCGAPA